VSGGTLRPMRVLSLTSIFPNAASPKSAPYIRQQNLALSRHCELRTWATLRWFPGSRLASRWSPWGLDTSRVPRVAEVDGLRVEYLRYLRIPRLTAAAGATYALSVLPRLVARSDRPDVIFATWAYPDGAAAIQLGRLFGIPTVIQVIGSDATLVTGRRAVRAQMRRLLPHAAGVVAVSQPLAEQMVGVGAPPERTHVICTGTDLERFRPRDRGAARESLGVPPDARLVLFVGRLFREKGVQDLLGAFDRLADRHPEFRLAIVGAGPERAACEARARALGDRLTVTGELGHDEIAQWIAACDVLTLPSWNEGTPNVILEALASGRPVVGTRVGGVPAVVRHAAQGELVAPRDVVGLAEALDRVARADTDPLQVVACSDLITWPENARRVLEILRAATRRP